MLIRFRAGQFPAMPRNPSVPAPTAGRYLEMDPPSFEVPAQVVIYGPGEPEVIDCTAVTDEDGATTIILPIGVAPPVGTPIQIILYGDPEAPTVIEATTADLALDGMLGIEIPDDIRM